MSFGGPFLEYPELFSARVSGEPSGDRDLLIDFVGGPYLFTGLSAVQAELVQERFDDLCVEPGAREEKWAVSAAVFSAPEEEFKTIDTRGWINHVDFRYASDSLEFSGNGFMARLLLEPRLEAALWTFHQEQLVSASAFENFFRVIVAYRILQLGGVLLHSAGLASVKGAWLFIGRSNAGKTTISRLGREAGLEVLSDDINAIFPEDGQFVAERLPFAGELAEAPIRSGRYPVRAIYQLEQGDSNEVLPLATAGKIAMLAVCAPFLNADGQRFANLVNNLGAMISRIPGYRLRFAKSSDFIKLLE